MLTNQDLFFPNFNCFFFFLGGGGGGAGGGGGMQYVRTFHTISEFVQSQDCIAHSQNPKIAFQSRDCAL